MNGNSLDGRSTKRPPDDVWGNASPDLPSMAVPVSPPRKRLRPDGGETEETPEVLEARPEAMTAIAPVDSQGTTGTAGTTDTEESKTDRPHPPPLRSPFQLTAVRRLPAASNVDTVTVKDVFGDPRVVECWNFNFCYDLPFLLGAFAQPQTVHLHVVHGFWLQGAGVRSRKLLEAQARQAVRPASEPGGFGAQHVQLHQAFLPGLYGTHHTKMAIFFRSDATAQVVIHTANMIPHDWENMTQAVWRSPLLPLLARGEEVDTDIDDDASPGAVGRRFKRDLLVYLHAYDHPLPICRPLEEQLARYDFSAVRAVLIGSVPGKFDVSDLRDGSSISPKGQKQQRTQGTKAGKQRPFWGWAAMKHALQSVPLRPPQPPPVPMAQVVVQMSSIAVLGPTDAWLRSTLFGTLAEGRKLPGRKFLPRPRFRIVFPTADEVRRSVVGYESGTSIHTKGKTDAEKRQLQYVRPMLCRWDNGGKNDIADSTTATATAAAAGPRGDARRARAMPHIKTYVRFAAGGDGAIDWALLTSANLSRQAWGEAPTTFGIMQIKSYELGVLVWPELLAEKGATMRPVFGRDTLEDQTGDGSEKPVVPLRMPYSLPLQLYGPNELPWIANVSHDEPDWLGQHWRVNDLNESVG